MARGDRGLADFLHNFSRKILKGGSSLNWIRRFWNGKSRGKRALALAGGGVTGGMFEVGCLAALDQALPGFRTNEFDIYIGTSSGSLVASLVANGVTPEALAQTRSEER